MKIDEIKAKIEAAKAAHDHHVIQGDAAGCCRSDAERRAAEAELEAALAEDAEATPTVELVAEEPDEIKIEPAA